MKAWWYNTRDGRAEAIGTFSRKGQREFVPPSAGEMLDWVLVLDDASRGYPPPGTRVEQGVGARPGGRGRPTGAGNRGEPGEESGEGRESRPW